MHIYTHMGIRLNDLLLLHLPPPLLPPTPLLHPPHRRPPRTVYHYNTDTISPLQTAEETISVRIRRFSLDPFDCCVRYGCRD